jgi:hypothetical protein
MLMMGRTAAGRVFWVERAGLALDARTDPPEVMTAEAFRAGLELIGRPVAIDRHGIKALWAEEEPRAAWAALMELLE